MEDLGCWFTDREGTTLVAAAHRLDLEPESGRRGLASAVWDLDGYEEDPILEHLRQLTPTRDWILRSILAEYHAADERGEEPTLKALEFPVEG